MIEAVFGECLNKTPGSMLIKTAGGIGYRVWVPVSYYSRTSPGQTVFLYTAYRIRDDEAYLYGFQTEKELEIFKKLLSVSGVGGKTALAVLSAYSVEEITHIFISRDDQRISAIPGIGKKTAQRMILELSGGLGLIPAEDGSTSPISEELISALVNLGFLEKKSRETVSKLLKSSDEGLQFEVLFKRALKEVSKR